MNEQVTVIRDGIAVRTTVAATSLDTLYIYGVDKSSVGYYLFEQEDTTWCRGWPEDVGALLTAYALSKPQLFARFDDNSATAALRGKSFPIAVESDGSFTYVGALPALVTPNDFIHITEEKP